MFRITLLLFITTTLISCSPSGRDKCLSTIENKNDLTLIQYKGFFVKYNDSTRQPEWVSYTLTAEEVAATENTPNIPHKFMEDPNCHLSQASVEDYRRSGWTRGHMARHMDMKWNTEAAQESDYMTNICPQNKKMNGGIWLKIENIARKLAIKYDSVNIVCGPIFTDTVNGTIGRSNIPVPDYFFKTFLVHYKGQYHSIAFICPNESGHAIPSEVVTTVNQVEALIRTNLYSHMDDAIEETVEDELIPYYWGL